MKNSIQLSALALVALAANAFALNPTQIQRDKMYQPTDDLLLERHMTLQPRSGYYYDSYTREYRPVSGAIQGAATAAEGVVEGAAVATQGVAEGAAQAVDAIIP